MSAGCLRQNAPGRQRRFLRCPGDEMVRADEDVARFIVISGFPAIIQGDVQWHAHLFCGSGKLLQDHIVAVVSDKREAGRKVLEDVSAIGLELRSQMAARHRPETIGEPR